MAIDKTIFKVIFLTLLIIPSLFLIQFSKIAFHEILPWTASGFIKFVGLILLLFVIFYALKKTSHVFLSWLTVFFIFFLITGHFFALVSVSLFTFSAILLGRFILRGDKFTLASYITEFLLGAGLIGSLTGFLAHFSVNYSSLYYLLVFIPIFIRPRTTQSVMQAIFQFSHKADFYKIDLTHALLFVLVGIHLAFALMPEAGNDALVFHLNVSTTIESTHKWAFDPGLYALSLIPMLGDWIFAFNFMLGGEAAAKLANLLFTLVLAIQVYIFVMEFSKNAYFSRVTSIILLSTPVAFLETNSLFVEGVWAVFIFQVFVTTFKLVSFNDSNENFNKNFLLFSSFSAFAFATKVISANIIIFLLIYILFNIKNIYKHIAIKNISLNLSIFLAFGLSCYFYAFYVTGNPVFPFFNAIFHSDYFPNQNFDNPLFKSELSVSTIYDVIFHSEKYIEGTYGAGGFQFLIFIPLSIFLILFHKDFKIIVMCLISILGIALIFHSQSYLRYIYPLIAIISALIFISLSLNSFVLKHIKLVKVFIYLAITLNILFLSSASWCYRSVPLNAIFKDEQKNYAKDFFKIRDVINFLNIEKTDNSRISFITKGTYAAYLKYEALYPNWYNYNFQENLYALKNQDSLIELVKKYNTYYFILDSDWPYPEQSQIIELGTTLVHDFGRYTLRRFDEKSLFIHEKIKNSEFTSITGWYLADGALFDQDNHFVNVSQTANASQLIEVTTNKYLFSITAKCDDSKAMVRAQINWSDAGKNFIGATNDVYNCTSEWKTYEKIISVPDNAKYAVIYAAAYDQHFIQIKKVSLK